MKQTILLIFALLAMVLTGLAASVTLAWDPNPEPDIAGYRIYWRTNGGTYATNRFVAVTNGTSGTVSNLFLGTTYRFVVTAYNTSGLESDYSNELMVTFPSKPTPPANVRTNQVTVAASLLRSESVGGPWVVAHTYDDVVLTNVSAATFYKTHLALAVEPPNHVADLTDPAVAPTTIRAFPPLPRK